MRAPKRGDLCFLFQIGPEKLARSQTLSRVWEQKKSLPGSQGPMESPEEDVGMEHLGLSKEASVAADGQAKGPSHRGTRKPWLTLALSK